MRMRWVKPEYYSDPWFVRKTPLTRLLYQGLWCFADDAGRFVADVALIHGQLLPLDPRKHVERSLKELADGGRIVTWEAGGLRYGLIPMFAIHQRIDKPQRSIIPVPPRDVAEAVEARLRGHPRWDSRFEVNLARMLHDDSGSIPRMIEETSGKTPASHARARLDQGTEGPGNQGTEEAAPTSGDAGFQEMRDLHAAFRNLHPQCAKVTLEKFAEIWNVNRMADMKALIARLKLEVQGEEWPWRDKNAAQVLRTRVVYADLDAARERAALQDARRAGSGQQKNAALGADELRDRCMGVESQA